MSNNGMFPIDEFFGAAPAVPVTANVNIEAVVREISNSCKEAAIARQEQETCRLEIRERTREHIAAFTAQLEAIHMMIEKNERERMPVIESLCQKISKPDINSYDLEACKMILDFLRDGDVVRIIADQTKRMEMYAKTRY